MKLSEQVNHQMTLNKLKIFALSLLVFLFTQACRPQQSSLQTGESSQANTNASANTGGPAGGDVPAGKADFFNGYVGESRIEMKLVRDGERLSGTYSYTKVGSNLELRGTIDRQGNLSLKEFDDKGTQTGLFKGKWTEDEIEKSGVIEGNWSKPDGSKETTVYLTQQHLKFQRGLTITSKSLREENKTRRYEYEVAYPQLQGAGGAGVEGFNREVSSWATQQVNEWKSGAGPEAGEEDASPGTDVDTFNISYAVKLGTDDLVSVIFNVYSYEHGAAHGNTSSYVINYDLKRARALKLSDLFKPGANYLQTVSDYSIKDLKRQARKESAEDPMLPDDQIEEGAAPSAENYQSWNLTETGLMFTFDSYQVGPYAAGPQRVLIPYTTLREMANPDGPIPALIK